MAHVLPLSLMGIRLGHQPKIMNISGAQQRQRQPKNRYKACSDQQSFLANEENKGAFLKLLTDQFLSNGHDVKQAPSDADTLIVRVALAAAAGGQHVTASLPSPPGTLEFGPELLLTPHWKPPFDSSQRS